MECGSSCDVWKGAFVKLRDSRRLVRCLCGTSQVSKCVGAFVEILQLLERRTMFSWGSGAFIRVPSPVVEIVDAT